MLQPAVSPIGVLETSVGVKIGEEVTMRTGDNIQLTRTTVKLTGSICLRFGIIVVAVAGSLLVAPLSRASKCLVLERPSAGFAVNAQKQDLGAMQDGSRVHV